MIWRNTILFKEGETKLICRCYIHFTVGETLVKQMPLLLTYINLAAWLSNYMPNKV